jgi:Tol biopolymer transport system component
MSVILPPAPPHQPDVDPLEALIKEARRRARRRRALYGLSALFAAGAAVSGFYGFNGGGGHAQARGIARPASPGTPQQSRPAPTRRAVENGPLALIDSMHLDRIVLIGLHGRFLRSLPICRMPRCGELESAAWSPDGRVLAYGTDSVTTRHPRDGLHLFLPARNRDRLLLAGAGGWSDLAWSPDGRKLAFSDGRVLVMPLARPQKVQVIATGSSPSWSPNGRLIAYDRVNRGIYVSRVDGTHVRRLTGSGSSPAWSPDGRLIAYRTNCGIRLMTPAGKDATPVSASRCAHIGLPGYATWSPDGRKLAFTANDGVYVMNRDGSGPTRIWGDTALRPAWRPVVR